MTDAEEEEKRIATPVCALARNDTASRCGRAGLAMTPLRAVCGLASQRHRFALWAPGRGDRGRPRAGLWVLPVPVVALRLDQGPDVPLMQPQEHRLDIGPDAGPAAEVGLLEGVAQQIRRVLVPAAQGRIPLLQAGDQGQRLGQIRPGGPPVGKLGEKPLRQGLAPLQQRRGDPQPVLRLQPPIQELLVHGLRLRGRLITTTSEREVLSGPVWSCLVWSCLVWLCLVAP
jgi:hypothetical protein